VPSPIRAAGGVVWRDDCGPMRIALIHRDRYDDWTLPKGKLHDGEREMIAAVREVWEETGATVAVSRRLIEVGYLVDGLPKTVRFWAMRYRDGDFAANAEVDDLAWLPLDEARARLSHDADRAVLDSFTATPVPRSVVVLVRHAKAGKRSQWVGDDRLRPLDKAGRRQARGLATFLPAFAPSRVVTADRVRCIQTLEPFAAESGLNLEITETFADEGYLADPDRARTELLAIAKSAPAAVICSQGTALPALVEELAGFESVSARKGAGWALGFADGAVVSADYYGNAAR
jgi:8-oxo-dGTP diphosphatase